MKQPGHRLGFMLVTASAGAWSTGGPFPRLISVDCWTMLAWRGILGALGLAVVLALMPQQGTWRSLRGLGWLGWFFVLQSSAWLIFLFSGPRATRVAHVAGIFCTAPL